jgi:hypothetical protein
MLYGKTIGWTLPKKDHVGVPEYGFPTRGHKVRKAPRAQVLAPVPNVVRLRNASVVDVLLDATSDVPPIDGEHGFDVVVARRSNDD